MAYYSIKDLEKLSGIKAHTLRIWEKRYNLVEPKRTETNIRFYDDDDLKKVLNVALLNRNGLKISHIASLDTEEINSKISDLSKRNQDSESVIENLVISMIELDEKKFEKILTRTIMQAGFENTILYTVYPFLDKIGILWQTGAINPAQEHFISNLVRQKLIVAIDSIIEEDRDDNMPRKRFVLFLPEGELHEIGLLFYYYLIKKEGHKTIYLGQSVPFNDLQSVVEIRACDFLLTSYSSNISGLNFGEYLEKLARNFPDQVIMFSTYTTAAVSNNLPENTRRLENAVDFQKFLEKISEKEEAG
jgi:DNA-binding transcriptional MerR regulator